MNFYPAKLTWSVLLVAALFAASVVCSQPNPLSSVKELHATDFTSEQYFEPPNDQQVKLKFSGAAADPLPGGLLAVKQMSIETFETNGVTKAIAKAPHCVLSPFDGVASSAGKLELQSGDGKFRVAGEGFMWRQSEQTLTLSNRVHTVLEMADTKL
jgi:hypothetical protein